MMADPRTLICIKHNGDEEPEDALLYCVCTRCTVIMLLSVAGVMGALLHMKAASVENLGLRFYAVVYHNLKVPTSSF
jgi:hypothetical protein